LECTAENLKVNNNPIKQEKEITTWQMH